MFGLHLNRKISLHKQIINPSFVQYQRKTSNVLFLFRKCAMLCHYFLLYKKIHFDLRVNVVIRASKSWFLKKTFSRTSTKWRTVVNETSDRSQYLIMFFIDVMYERSTVAINEFDCEIKRKVSNAGDIFI